MKDQIQKLTEDFTNDLFKTIVRAVLIKITEPEASCPKGRAALSPEQRSAAARKGAMTRKRRLAGKKAWATRQSRAGK